MSALGVAGDAVDAHFAAQSTRQYASSAAIAVGAVTVIWFSLIIAAHGEPDRTSMALAMLGQMLSAAMFLASAAVCSGIWHITGGARVAWSAAALLVIGVAMPVTILVALIGGNGNLDSPVMPTIQVCITIVLVGIAAAALATPHFVTWLSPMRVALPLVALCLVGAGLAIVYGGALPAPFHEPHITNDLHYLAAVLTTMLAVAFAASGMAHHRRGDVIIGAAMSIPAVGSFIRALHGDAGVMGLLITAGAQLAISCAITILAAAYLWQLHTGRGRRLVRVADELSGARDDIARIERSERQRLHDARTALVGLSAALGLLADARAEDIDQERLRGLMSIELSRMTALLDPAEDVTRSAFAPCDDIEALVYGYRLDGVTVTTDMDADARAFGDPHATINAVSNLLRNAYLHAPGANIWVSVHADDNTVAITVADDGPGIPAGERDFVVLAGVRGGAATAPGSGLGLASVAQAMSDQGGTIRVGERTGGGTAMTLTLPRAGAALRKVEAGKDTPAETGTVGMADAAGAETAAPVASDAASADWAEVSDIEPAPAATSMIEMTMSEGAAV